MEIVLDEFEVNKGTHHLKILANLRTENTADAQTYFSQLESALVIFNTDVARIIKENSAAS